MARPQAINRIGLLGVGLIGLWWLWPATPIEHGPGPVAPDAPVQIDRPGVPFSLGDYRLEPVADFELEARVLSTEDYRWGREADLSPMDLALGWGPMSDETVLAAIDISQGGRFYRWRVVDFPIPRQDIETHSANMHVIPADRVVDAILDKLRPGHVVRLRGQLVNAYADDGWHWRTSLTRNDTGAGACELFYVESVDYRGG